jgi:hypothetical protein
VNCYHCGSGRIRLSRIRASDIVRIFQLKIPVRCRSCMERRHVNLFLAWKKGIVGKPPRKEPQRQKKIDRGESAA